MPMGTLERSAPPFFKQGPSALSRLAVFSALAFLLMVADARFRITDPLRQVLAVVLYPVQWLMLKPVELAHYSAGYFQALESAQGDLDVARKQMVLMGQRANQAQELTLENGRLRQLLNLRDRLETPAQAAQVIYDTPDVYTRRVVIDRGQLHGIAQGSPVMDESGVLGQVTRVFPAVSEVTLLVDRDQAIPVLNVRTGVRGVAYGDPVTERGSGMELRFMPANTDIREGDLLTTSGVDGLYPSGLPVATVVRVERRADSAFARIYCAPLARTNAARHVVVLTPLAERALPSPPPAPAASSAAGRGRR